MGFNFFRREKQMPKDNLQDTFDSETASALSEAVFKAGKTRKTPKTNETGESEETRPGIPQQAAEQLQRLFEPEQWEPICEMPFNLIVATTGRKEGEATEKEIKKLSVTTSMTAQYFMAIDPKYVALILFLLNWGSVLAIKGAAIKMAILREQEEKRRLAGGNISDLTKDIKL